MSSHQPKTPGRHIRGRVGPITGMNPRELVKGWIERYTAGDKIEQIAAEHGITTQRVYTLLLQFDPDGWKAAQAGQGVARYEAAISNLEQSNTMVEVSKHTALGKQSAWLLERVAKNVYGENNAPLIQINLGSTLARIADLERELGIQVSPTDRALLEANNETAEEEER